MSAYDPKSLRTAPLATPTDLKSNAITDISGALNILLADMFALYIKTKNFHWHVSGQHFRDYHLMLDEQGEQIFATTDDIAERVRKDRWHHDPLHRPYRAPQARSGQRC
jgi:starvation-inducible DNA-binding protein